MCVYSLIVATNDNSQKCPVHNTPSAYDVNKPFQNLPATKTKCFRNARQVKNSSPRASYKTTL